MSDTIDMANSPGRDGARAPLVMAEARVGAAWNVQGDPEREAFMSTAQRLFGIALPSVPNTLARGASITAYWLGPGSWLLTGAMLPSPDGFVAARDALNAAGGAVFDVSASRIAFSVQGTRAADVLAAGCPLDFDDAAFPAGSCRQSVFLRVAVLIERHDDASGYTVLVARSLSSSVWHGLTLSAAEYGWKPSGHVRHG